MQLSGLVSHARQARLSGIHRECIREISQPAAEDLVRDLRADIVDQGPDPRPAGRDDPPPQRVDPAPERPQDILRGSGPGRARPAGREPTRLPL
jgi:hypothetical protein